MSHPATPPVPGTTRPPGPGTAAAKGAAAAEAEHDHGRRWWTLATLGLAQLMVVLDATIVKIGRAHV